MIVAVGDLHAYDQKFKNLMGKLRERIDFEKDTVIFLGDYIDGGPGAAITVTCLMALEKTYPHWKFLMGNHEDMLIACTGWGESICGESHGNDYTDDFYLWYNQGGQATFESYRDNADMTDYEKALANVFDVVPDSHFQWMRTRPLMYETDKFIFVHAGLNPDGLTTNFDKLWIRNRFIHSNKDFGKRVIFGHTYQPEPLVMKNKICIDTMHHGGGLLTAVLLDEERPEWYDFVRSDF